MTLRYLKLNPVILTTLHQVFLQTLKILARNFSLFLRIIPHTSYIYIIYIHTVPTHSLTHMEAAVLNAVWRPTRCGVFSVTSNMRIGLCR
jgi:hypothetical protein